MPLATRAQGVLGRTGNNSLLLCMLDAFAQAWCQQESTTRAMRASRYELVLFSQRNWEEIAKSMLKPLVTLMCNQARQRELTYGARWERLVLTRVP